MTSYFVDSNFWLRFLLQDNLPQSREVRRYMKLAKNQRVRLVLRSEVVMECVYVLERVYRVPREKVGSLLGGLVKTFFLDVPDRRVLLSVFDVYLQSTVDFLDVFLYELAREEGGKVLSFDKDFLHLRKRFG